MFDHACDRSRPRPSCDGTLSSSDGLRLPTRGKSLTGRALSRYFVHEGLTSYTHVSDQHS
ncbi:MAG: transposase, partial [Actinobacteria bacterium]|nr:transposase [Actinomycetota bacterium]